MNVGFRILMGEHRLRMLRDRVLRKIFGHKGELVTGRELHGFYSPDYECRRMSWMRHVTCSAENRNV
jgi:hypothetical protein